MDLKEVSLPHAERGHEVKLQLDMLTKVQTTSRQGERRSDLCAHTNITQCSFPSMGCVLSPLENLMAWRGLCVEWSL